MKDSHYQEISLSKIPVVQTPGGKGIVKAISAKAFDIQLVIETKIPILYLHFILRTRSQIIEQSVLIEYNVFAYVISEVGNFLNNNKDKNKDKSNPNEVKK